MIFSGRSRACFEVIIPVMNDRSIFTVFSGRDRMFSDENPVPKSSRAICTPAACSLRSCLGSCLCGAIKFELDHAPDAMNSCHCSMCRKITGAAYGFFAPTDFNNFRWISGVDTMTRYESSPGNLPVFCTTCGSHMPSWDPDSAQVCLPAGCFDDDPQLRPAV